LGQLLTDPFKLLGIAQPSVPAQPKTNLVNPIDFIKVDAEKKKKEEADDQIKFTKEQVLADPAKMDTIRKFMSTTADSIYSNKPDPTFLRKDVKTDEEAYDAYMTHMRWFESNAAYTAKEAIDVGVSNDQDRVVYGEGFKLYDHIANAATSEGFGGAMGATKDYVLGVATDPTTYMSFGLGKMFGGKLASEAGKEGIIKMAEKVAEGVTAASVKKGATKIATKEANREVVRAASKVYAKRALAINLTSDAALSSVQDILAQDTYMKAGAQDQFSVAQNIMATLIGSSSSVLSAAHFKPVKGASGLTDAGAKIDVANAARKSAVSRSVTKDMEAALTSKQIDWINLAKEGGDINNDSRLGVSIRNWFFDIHDPNSFTRILQKNGVKIDDSAAGSYSHNLVQFAQGLDEEARTSLNKMFSEHAGITFDQATSIFANVMREEGQGFNKASTSRKFLEAYQNVAVTNKKAADTIIDAEGLAKEGVPNPQLLKYWGSVFKRLITSHPGTTVVNVKGWGISQGIKVPAQALQMASLWGFGRTKKMLGMESGDLQIGQAKALWQNLGYMTRVAIDPFTTVKGFSDLVDRAPKETQKKIHHHFFQGVDMGIGPEKLGVNPQNKLVKATEGYITMAQRVSLVHAQDVVTKAMSGVVELDKQARLHLGMGLDEVLLKNKTHEITDEMWENATRVLQEDTFSQSFAGQRVKGKNIPEKFSDLAAEAGKISQEISRSAIGGFIWPFGQFVNSMLAFTWKHSPLGLVHEVTKLMAGSKLDMNMGERMSRGIVGSTAVYMAAMREGDKQDEGLQWFEERDSDGAVHRVDNMFPLGLLNLVGRMGYNRANNIPIDKQLIVDLGRQLAVPSALKDLGSFEVVKLFGEYFVNEQEDGADPVATTLIQSVASSVAGIVGGLTRPLDPLNDLGGAYLDYKGVINTAAIDKKQAEGVDAIIQKASSYTNNFFSLLIGTPDETGRKIYGEPKRSATSEGDLKSGNPVMATFGTPSEQNRTAITTLLGQINKPPFRVDSFSGDAAYDNFVNSVIFPVLEEKAKVMLASPAYQKLSMNDKMKAVNLMLSHAKTEINTKLNSGLMGGLGGKLLIERKNLLSIPPNDIAEAKRELGITKQNDELDLYEIERIKGYVKLSDKILKSRFGN